MTKAPSPTEMSKGQSDNTDNATKKVRLNSGCGPMNAISENMTTGMLVSKRWIMLSHGAGPTLTGPFLL